MGTDLKVAQPTRGHGALERYLSRRRAAKADQLIEDAQRSGRILDIGCGSFPLFLAKTRFAEKWGVDQVFDAETRYQLVEGHAIILPFDAHRDTRLPFAEDFFSVVTMLAVFEHIEPKMLSPLLGEVRRVLQPGGFFIITTPAHWTKWILNLMTRLRLVSHLEIEEHKGSYSQSWIRSALEAGGFDPRKIESGSFEAGANLWARARE